MGEIVTSASALTCPHGGTVTLTASAPLVIDGQRAVGATDAASIDGCSEADPCRSITWGSQGGEVVAGGIEVVAYPESAVCMAESGAEAGPPVVTTGNGGAATVF
jgi:hypothetical protein